MAHNFCQHCGLIMPESFFFNLLQRFNINSCFVILQNLNGGQQKVLESFVHTMFAQHASNSAYIWCITSEIRQRETRHPVLFYSPLMCSGFCWLGASRPSHQAAAAWLALRRLTLIEGPNYPNSSLRESLAAAGKETCNETGHRLEPRMLNTKTADQSTGRRWC